MTRLLSSSPRLFTVEAANKMLPLVSVIAAELIPLWEHVSSTGRRLEHLTEMRGVEQGNPYSDELAAMQERLDEQTKVVESLIEELRELRVEFKSSGSQAHVCFPAMLEGKLVYLSWSLGDADVSHWVEFDGEFSDRQKLMQHVGSGIGLRASPSIVQLYNCIFCSGSRSRLSEILGLKRPTNAAIQKSHFVKLGWRANLAR